MQLMNCRDYRAWLVGSFVEADEAHAAAAAAHAAGCKNCAAARPEMQAAWECFWKLPPLEPPPAVQAAARHAVLDEMARERRMARRRRWLEASQVPLAVASGVLVAGATLALVGGIVWGSVLANGHVLFCAASFTGLLVGAFSWIYRTTTVNGIRLDVAARVGILALAISVAATVACPELSVLAWWDGSAAGRMFTRIIGPGGSSLVFGFLYGVAPGFLAAIFGGQLRAERPIANGLVAVAAVVLLATPVIYLQSASLTTGVLASWIAGTSVGTLCGVFGALKVGRRVPFAAAAQA